MIQIRRHIFETNSSSVHSISISREEVITELDELNARQGELIGYLREMDEEGIDRIDREEWV